MSKVFRLVDFLRKQRDKILSILSTSFDGDDGGLGNILFVLSGNAGIRYADA